MTTPLENAQTEEAPSLHRRLFRSCLAERVKLGEITRKLPDTSDMNCLTVGGSEAMIAGQLHQRGGKWTHLVVPSSDLAAVQASLDAPVKECKGRKFPFKDKVFDVVVVIDALERSDDEASFITECHRVLQPSGNMVLCVPHVKPWSLVAAYRAVLGQTPERCGLLRAGYTEHHLFAVLKNGFDVHSVTTYLRFFLESSRIVARAMRNPDVTHPDPLTEGHVRLYKILYPFFWLGYQLDFLLFFVRGHHIVAVGKRRAWLPRKTPVLSDGRSISEAVLSRIRD